jgi:hypothetical protein
VKRTRPTKAAKAASKGTTAPATEKRRGGPPAATAGPSEAEIRRRVYDSALADAETLAEAKSGLEELNSSQAGVEAARVDLAELEAGTDIAAEIAEKVFPYPKKGSKDRKADARFLLSQGLEDLGWWLAEVPQGGKKARWRAILPGRFNDEDRYSSDERSATRWTLSMTAGLYLIEDIATRLKHDQDNSDRIPPILEILESNREEVRAFLERFFQRVKGNRAEALQRRQQTAEALARGTTPPMAEGGEKTLENDLAWIRARKRPLFPTSKKKKRP